MKKFLAMLLAVVMVLSMAACSKQPAKDPNKGNDDPNQTQTITNPDQINDEMTSEDGKYEIAFITDVGQLKDKSFNQGTYDGVKLYAANNKLSYKYYQPANKDQATDDDRYEAMKAAVENGAKVVVCAGFMQEGALRMAAKEFPNVSFVFVDGYPITEEAGVDGSPVLKNVAGIAFKEEQCGYLAGYAVVKEGFTKLGFTGGGGGTNPACCRYGYGFVQGADAAAKELGVKVDMNYSWQYGASFSASPELQTMVSGWYEAGTEVVFACGGSMFASISNYKQQWYYDAHPYFFLYTNAGKYRVDLFAGIVVPGTHEVFSTSLSADQLQRFINNSTFYSGKGVPSGQIVTLCTCSYEAANYRYVVLGELVKLEDTPADTAMEAAA